jgi:hypothetical protein
MIDGMKDVLFFYSGMSRALTLIMHGIKVLQKLHQVARVP